MAGEIMVVLITGASHTGRTALAQKLLEKYKYPYLSISQEFDILIMLGGFQGSRPFLHIMRKENFE